MRNFYLLAAILCITSCGPDNDSSLKGVDWVVDYFENNDGKKTNPDVNYILNMADAQYTLRLDVNTCFGTLSTSGNDVIKFKSPGCTEICCDTETAQELTSILATCTKYKISGVELLLEGSGGSILLFTN